MPNEPTPAKVRTALTNAACQNATCPPDKVKARFYDTGGLYLQVSPNGSKRWFLKYRADGVEKQMALGSYQATSLAAARLDRDKAKAKKTSGRDPIEERKINKLKASTAPEDTFQGVAREWFAKQAPEWSNDHANRTTALGTHPCCPSCCDKSLTIKRLPA